MALMAWNFHLVSIFVPTNKFSIELIYGNVNVALINKSM